MKKIISFLGTPLFCSILFLTCCFMICLTSQAQLNTCKYETPITVLNTTNAALTNYPTILKVNTQIPISLGWMKNDGSDIRFASDCGTTTLNYFLESYINTDSTKIWVKISLIPANDSVRIFMYYGNPVATSTSTPTIFNGPWSSTDSVVVTTTNSVSLCQRGFHFTANAPVLVTHFGKRTPNATQRYVTLFNFTTQAIVAQAQVDAGTVGSYNYNALTTPFWLTSGQQYVLELFNGSGDMYYYGTSSQISPSFTYINMMYCNSCTQNTFPTSTLTNYHYGCPDFLYWVRTQVATSEPLYSFYSPADTNTPAPPTGVHALQGDQQVTVGWAPNTEFDMYYYKIFRDTINDPNSAVQVDSAFVPDTSKVNSGLTNGTKYFFWLKAMDRYCQARISGFSAPDSVIPNPIGIVKNSNEIPKVYNLYQNLPNPFNPTTTIKFDIPKTSMVTLVIYDILGKEVAQLVNARTNAGRYQITWFAGNQSSGVYFCRITAGDYVNVKKMILVK
ncbi:MAG: DUF2341 domain-containing protein [Ignavibacteria bacterium]|jgi:hypothetical protein